MIAIIDYGVGNLFSLVSSLKYIGQEAEVTADEATLTRADKLILPGVGAFEDASARLRTTKLDQLVIREAARGKPILGICLGMQMLFEKSLEFGTHEGLGLLRGVIAPIPSDAEHKIPHMGWNALQFKGEKSPLFKYIDEGDHVYFVHSYHAVDCENSVIATTEYGMNVTAAVAQGNVFGAQFHPEKSGTVGLNILRAFAEM
ncbi:MAG: imidazole glycerol phosphate synthase subunit HisH [Oscillospiraceae bacterium]|nr:imidazole glycerol phosphate synthase subunit HisH [Oscillospiraceae bacterium]